VFSSLADEAERQENKKRVQAIENLTLAENRRAREAEERSLQRQFELQVDTFKASRRAAKEVRDIQRQQIAVAREQLAFARKYAKKKSRSGLGGAFGSLAGAAIGGVTGGVPGATLGAQIGGGAGSFLGAF